VLRSLDSLVLIFAGPSVIFAPACWEESVGDAGEERRGWVGIPRAEARLFARADDSLLTRRGAPANLGGSWCASAFDAAESEESV
jgi:hypothetical protein